MNSKTAMMIVAIGGLGLLGLILATIMWLEKISPERKALIRISVEVADNGWFWDTALKDLGIEWYRPYRQVLDRSKGIEWTSWFLGGRINIVHNCIDRHQPDVKARPALIWEGDDGTVRRVTYGELNW